MTRLNIIHDEGLIREIRYRKHHERQRQRHHTRFQNRTDRKTMLFGCASRTVNVYGSGGILRYGSLLFAYRLSAILHHQCGDQHDHRQHQRTQKRQTITDVFLRANTQCRSDRHSQRVHRAIQSHAGTHMPDRQQKRHPRGQADRAACETNAVDHASHDEHDGGVCGIVQQSGGEIEHRANRHKRALAGFVGKIACDRAAEQ